MADEPVPPAPAAAPASRTRIIVRLLLLAVLLTFVALRCGQRSLQRRGSPGGVSQAALLAEHGVQSERGVLFIGNSLTYYYDLPCVIQYLAQAAGETRRFEYGQDTELSSTVF